MSTRAAQPARPQSGSIAVGRGRRAGFALVVAGVVLVHAWITSWVADEMSRFGLGDSESQRVARMEVAFVRELQPAAPPAVAPTPAAAPRPRPRSDAAPRPAPPAASGPEPAPAEAPASAALVADAASAPLALAAMEPAPNPSANPTPNPASSPTADAVPIPVDEPTALASAPPGTLMSTAPSASHPSAPGPAAVPANPQATAFEWPPSTRLRYRLTGNYRGEVHGSAQVQWVLVGTRYQVHLDVLVGPSFAPLVSRRMTSDGEVGPDGLRPLRYDEETAVAFRAPRRAQVRFTPEAVRLSNGREVEPMPGVQDTASQFVQMTWLFTVDPTRLEPGRVLEMPLALPRRQELWLYDVLGREAIDTPMGLVDTVHLKPRRVATTGSDLTAEAWFAPSMQYLPVRILIRQDAQTHVDLIVDGPPMQAER